MSSHFKNDIVKVTDKEIEELTTLPIAHTSDERAFRSVIENRYLKRHLCPIFNESLAYFFYALPVYLKKDEPEPYIMLFKVCESINYERIIPFDSGGYFHYFKKNRSDNLKESIDAYWAEKNTKGHNYPKRIIKKIFGGNNDYYEGKTINVNIAEQEFDLHPNEYVKMINDKNRQETYEGEYEKDHSPYDIRCSAIELQFKYDLSLGEHKLIYAILPTQRLGLYEKIIKDTLGYKVDLVGYSGNLGNDQLKMIEFIKDSVKEYLEEEKYL